MREVNIYTQTSIRSMRKTDGMGMFVLEYYAMTNEGNRVPVTMDKAMELTGMTANEAETFVLMEALGHLREKCSLTVYTESAYVAGAFKNGWIENWKNNGWKGSKGKEVEHKEMWQEIEKRTEGMEVEARWGEDHEYRKWMQMEYERRMKDV